MIPSYRGSLEVALMIGQHSHDFRDLQRSVEKAHGDRERAIRNVCVSRASCIHERNVIATNGRHASVEVLPVCLA